MEHDFAQIVLEAGVCAAWCGAARYGFPRTPGGEGLCNQDGFRARPPLGVATASTAACVFRAGTALLFTATASSTGIIWACAPSASYLVHRATAIYIRHRTTTTCVRLHTSTIYVLLCTAATGPAGVRERTTTADTCSFWSTWSTTAAAEYVRQRRSMRCCRGVQSGALIPAVASGRGERGSCTDWV